MVVKRDLLVVVEQQNAFMGQIDDRIQFDIALEELLVLVVNPCIQIHVALGVAQQPLVDGVIHDAQPANDLNEGGNVDAAVPDVDDGSDGGGHQVPLPWRDGDVDV
jgi:hypothetical protein